MKERKKKNTTVRAAICTASDNSSGLPHCCTYCSAVAALPSKVEVAACGSAPATISDAMRSAGHSQLRANDNGASWMRTSDLGHNTTTKSSFQTFCKACHHNSTESSQRRSLHSPPARETINTADSHKQSPLHPDGKGQR
jgi:hypothetical protein